MVSQPRAGWQSGLPQVRGSSLLISSRVRPVSSSIWNTKYFNYMIIRNQVIWTLKASPLNNRGYERSEHPRTAITTHPLHPKRVPQQVQVELDPMAGATLSESMQYAFLFRGCSLRSYPRLLSEDRVAVSLVVSTLSASSTLLCG